MPSVNDNFADAIEVTIATNGGTYTSPSLANTGNTTETNEPIVGSSGSLSMWFKYTPTSSGTATFDTQLTTAITSTDSYMAIWTGSALANLVNVGADDDGGGSGTSRIAGLSVTAGTTYWVQCAGYGNHQMNMVLRVTGPATSGGGGGTTGALSASVPRVRSTIAGTVTAPVYTGTVNGSVPRVRSSIAGATTVPNYPGTLTAAIPPTRSTIAGTVTAPSGAGTLSATLPLVAGSLPGAVVAPSWTGTLDGQLAPVTGTIAGTATGPVFTGSLTATLAPLDGDVTGTVITPAGTGSLAATLPRATASITGVVEVDDELVPPSARIVTANLRAPTSRGTLHAVTASGTLRTPTAQGRLR